MHGAQVLVVEDEPLICDLIIAALEDEGLVVACAASPQAAFAELQLHAASLRALITDVNLGTALTGFDVAREARRRLPQLVVLYTTGHAEADLSAHGVADALLAPKPYRPTELAQRIAALVQTAGGAPGAIP